MIGIGLGLGPVVIALHALEWAPLGMIVVAVILGLIALMKA